MPTTDFNLLVSSSINADAGNSLTLKGAMADGASAIGTVVGSSVTQANATAKLLSVVNNVTEKASIDYSGALTLAGGITCPGQIYLGNAFGAQILSSLSAQPIQIFGGTAALCDILLLKNGSGTQKSSIDSYGLFNGGVNAVGGVSASALPTPVNGTHTTTATGGDLVPGTYYYRVSATNALGETLASTETSIVVPAGTNTNKVTVVWGHVLGATGYKVYGRTTGAETLLTGGTVTNYALQFVDTGTATAPTATVLPTLNSTGRVAITGVSSTANAISLPLGSRIAWDSGSYLTSTGATSVTAAQNFLVGGILYSDTIKDFNGVGPVVVKSTMADGASAIGVTLGSVSTWSNATAKLCSFQNNAAEKAYIDKDGNYITSGDIEGLLYGKPTWVGTVVTTAGSPVSTASTAVPFTLTANAVYFVQPDVSCYMEVCAAGSMTLAGAKSVVLEALEKYFFQVKTGSLVYSFDVASGSANIKFFQMS